jgi:hypothetical protein
MQENNNFTAEFTNDYENARTAQALDFAQQFSDAPVQTDAPDDAAAQPAAQSDADATIPDAREGLGIGRDIGLGVMQSPRSGMRGVTKGINNMVGLVDDVVDFLPDITNLTEDGDRSFIPRIVSGNEFDKRLNKERAKDGKDALPDAPALPVPDAPAVPTVTGAIIEGIAQFLIGFKGVDKFAKSDVAGQGIKNFLSGKGAVPTIVKGAAADLLAFEGHEDRLSNVIESVPALQNPVTAFLAADPDDSAAEAKLKQAVEGLSLGGFGEALFRGVKLLRSSKRVAEDLKAQGKKPEDIFDIPEEERAGIHVEPEQFNFLGDVDDDALLRQRKLDDATQEVSEAFGKTPALSEGAPASIDDFEINFARIEGPDDIKQLMDEMVNKPELKDSIDKARRGKRDAKQTLAAAEDIDGFDSLMGRRVGDAFNADQIVAARKVYYDTTEKLMDAAKRAAGPEASDIDVFNFRKMVSLHHAVQKEFMGVRAEAGRALAAWRIPVGGSGADNARFIGEMLTDFGGADVGKQLARQLAAAGESLNTSQINAITQKGAGARTLDAATEAWTLGILTNPTTHTVNLGDSLITGLMMGAERIGMAFAKDSPVTLKEGTAFFQGWIGAQKMAVKNAAQALRSGQTGFGMGKIDLPRTRATSREILDPEGKAGFISKGIDGWGWLLNKYVGGMLAAGDEYNKTLMFQSQMRALATRDGIAQGMDPDGLKTHVANVLADPPSHLTAQAQDFANYATYTRELGAQGRKVQDFINRWPALRFVAPFVRTPANIFKFTFSRTPLGLLSENVRADIAAGGARRAAATTRMAVGTSIMAMTVDFALNGKITGTGPIDGKQRSALRRTGWQPNSVKIGENYYSYGRLGYLGTVLGMGADMAEIMSNYEAYDLDAQQETDQLALASIMAASNQVMGKTFMSGMADLVEALSDPKRYGPYWAKRFAGSVVPAGVAAVERAINPEIEQSFNMIDAMKARIPGLSDQVPNRLNVWGEEIKTFYPNEKDVVGATAERLLSLVNPVYYSAQKDAPVDRWLLKNGFSVNMPQKTQVFDGVRIDLREFPQAYHRLVQLRGGELKMQKYGNQTMKSFFKNLASEEDPFGRHIGFFMALGNSYEDQQNFISSVVRDYNKAAREQVLEEFPEISERIGQERRNAANLGAVRPSLKDLQGE